MFLKVVVKLAATVRMDLLNQLCSQGSNALIPLPDVQDVQTAIQTLDVILRHQSETSMRPGYAMINYKLIILKLLPHIHHKKQVYSVTLYVKKKKKLITCSRFLLSNFPLIPWISMLYFLQQALLCWTQLLLISKR